MAEEYSSVGVIPLTHAFYVDQAIMTEEERLVVIRFGSNEELDCMVQDECLKSE
jgi:DIM1 family U5 snRNP protein